MSKKDNKNSDSAKISVGVYQGPIPPAVELDHYKQIDPTFPDRIMKMAENYNRSNTIIKTRFLFWGLVILALIIFISLIASIYFATKNEPIYASLFGIVPLLSVIKIIFNKI